jgi:predicted NBD/HSP70 family sugar kinase
MFINISGPLGAVQPMLAMPDEHHFTEAPERDRARVLAAIAAGARSRPEIGERLGMRSTTTSRAVAELLSRRLLLEASGEPRGRGRPAATLLVNARRAGVSVIHVASRSFVGVLLDLGGQVLERRVVTVEPEAGNAALGAVLAGLAVGLAAAAPRGMSHAGTVVSVSGLVDVRRRQWLVSSRWPRMRHFDIEAAIAPAAGPVDVVRHLDADLRTRALADPVTYSEDVVLLHWGWGIGMSYAVGGQPFGVAGGPFGEIGHWRINGLEARSCGCGRQGCLETVAGLWSLLPVLRSRWPDLAEDEDTLLGQLRGLDLLAVPEIHEAARHMARVLGNVCRILFPAHVVVSSPLMGNTRLWAHFDALFRAEGLMDGMAPPRLHNDPLAIGHGITGAAAPLLGRGVEALLREPG